MATPLSSSTSTIYGQANVVPNPTGNQPAQPTPPGAFMPTPVAPVTPTKLVPPPAVSTPAAAQENNAKIQSFLDQNKAGVQAQQTAKATAAATPPPTPAPAQTPDKTLTDISSQIKEAISPTNQQPQHIVAGDSATSADGLTKGEFVTNQNTGMVSFFASGTTLPFDYLQKTQVTLPSGKTGYTDTKGNFYSQDGTPLDSASASAGTDLVDYQKNIAQNNAQSDATYADMQSKVTSITNGTFPLNSWQQGLVDSINQQLKQNLAAQKIANANYEGGVKVSLYRSGEIQSPEVAQGEIMAAVSAGVAKIADLEGKASQEIAKLEEGFQKDDYDMVMKSYDAANTYLKNKSDEIQKMYDATATAQDKLRTYNLDLVKAQLESDKFDWQQKQDIISNAQKDQQLTETQRKDLADEAYKAQTLALQKGIQVGLDALGAKPVTADSSGNPNPQQQQDYLSHFSTDMQLLLKGIADYSIPLTVTAIRQFKGATGLTTVQVAEYVKGYDPSFNDQLYSARQSYLTNFTGGKLSTQIGNINTTINHIGELKGAADDLNGLIAGGTFFGLKSYNNIASLIAENAGNPAVAKYNSIIDKVASEISAAYAESTGGERSAQQIALDINNSPAQKDAIMSTTLNLLSGLTTSIAETYQSRMGKTAPTNSILFPTAQATINDLKTKGLNVDTNSFIPNPLAGTNPQDLYNQTVGASEANNPVDKNANLQALLQQMNALNQSNTATQ